MENSISRICGQKINDTRVTSYEELDLLSLEEVAGGGSIPLCKCCGRGACFHRGRVLVQKHGESSTGQAFKRIFAPDLVKLISDQGL